MAINNQLYCSRNTETLFIYPHVQYLFDIVTVDIWNTLRKHQTEGSPLLELDFAEVSKDCIAFDFLVKISWVSGCLALQSSRTMGAVYRSTQNNLPADLPPSLCPLWEAVAYVKLFTAAVLSVGVKFGLSPGKERILKRWCYSYPPGPPVEPDVFWTASIWRRSVQLPCEG